MKTHTGRENPNITNEGFLRGLKLMDAMTLVIGTVIGSGIFIVSADIARIVHSPGVLLIVWLIAGIMSMAGALSYAELAAAMPKAGGQYVFLSAAFGKLPAFLYGWTFFLVMSSGIIAAVAVAFSKFLGILLPEISATRMLFAAGPVHISTQQFVAMTVIGVLTYVNCRGVKQGALIQNIFTFLKVFAIFALVIAGFAIGRNPDAISLNFANMFSTAPKGFGLVTSIGAAMVGSLFAMDAWAYVCSTAVEVENPRRNIPRALLYGTGFVALLYIVVNIAYMHVLPLMGNPDSADLFSRGIAYASEDRVATAIAQSMLGSAGLYVIAVAIMISTFGCVNGNILMNARLFYAMARDGLFFKSVGRVSTKTHVPTMALITSGIWSASLTLTGSYSQLLDYVIFATLIFYGMTIIALFVLRKKMPDMKRPYRAWGYPWLQILYIALASLIAVDLLVYKPAYTWPGLIIVISGVPVYYIWRLLSKGPVAELMPELEDAE